METDYRFRKNHCSYFSLLSTSRTNIQRKSNFDKKNRITNSAIDFSSSRNLLRKSPRENHFLPFFPILLSPKATFPSSENIFFIESFIEASVNLFSDCGNSFSGQYKPFFMQFSETPASESFFSVQRKRIFKRILYSASWKRIFFSSGNRLLYLRLYF